jgi:uncharacterized RDD family membrane protein YckC
VIKVNEPNINDKDEKKPQINPETGYPTPPAPPQPLTQPQPVTGTPWPPSRPFYPGQPGSEYSYAPPAYGSAAQPYNYYPQGNGYNYSDDRVGVAQVEIGFWTRFGAHFIDTIITSFISGIVLGIPLLIWTVGFVNKHYDDLQNICSTTRGSIECQNEVEQIFWRQGEIVSLIAILGGFGLLALALVLTYYVGMTARGATVGKKVFGIKVVKSDGTPPGFGVALLRQTIGYGISGAFFALGFLWVAFDKHHQGWHDKIANTYVVRA